MNRLIGGIIGGAVGGAIGAAIWAAIAYFTGYEIGYVAWGVGLLVGLGVAMGAQEGNPLFGVIAVVIALASVAGGRYFSIELSVQEGMAEVDAMMQEGKADFFTDETALNILATDTADAWMAQGVALEWPAGYNNDNADEPHEYPTVVWDSAVEQWEGMSADEQDAFLQSHWDAINQELTGMADAAVKEGFADSFDIIDVVFALLAIATAYQVAASAGGDE
jgi:hypothetical protein